MDDVTNPEAEVTDDVNVEDDFEAFEETASEEDEGTAETDEGDNPEGPQEPEEDSDEVEFEINGKTYRAPKDAVLRQQDYTQKTQALAEQRKQLEATLERINSVSQAETQAIAQVAIVAAQIKQYDDIDWNAWDETDPVAANRARWELTQLQQQQQAAVAQYQKVGSEKLSVVQQETAKRLEEADRFAAQNIPGWNRETAQATLDFSRATYGLSDDELAGAIADKPEVLLLLHDAMEGRKLRAQSATKAKIEKQQAVKPVTTLKGNTGGSPVSPATTDFAAFEKLAARRR